MLYHLFILLIMQQPKQPVIDDKAKAVIESMTHAYQSLQSLEQETDYENAGTLQKSKLVIQRPNRLLFEMSEKLSQVPETQLTRTICDGKDLYVYRQAKGWYTQAKAPKDFKGFAQLASTLELAAIAGLDPFKSLIEQASEVKMDPPGNVQGEPVDVVRVDTLAPDQSSIIRLYVGQSDHLLRRFAVESTVILPPPTPEEAANQKELPPIPVAKMAWEHRVTVNKGVNKSFFVWIVPPGALPYQSSFEPPRPPANQKKQPKQKNQGWIWLNKVHPKNR